MDTENFYFEDSRVVIHLKDRVCDSPDELIASKLFYRVLERCTSDLARKNSHLLDIFDHSEITRSDLKRLITTFKYLAKLPADLVMKVVPGSEGYFADRLLLNDFVEHMYNYWRSMQRLIVCNSEGDRFDQRPYHTFNNTVETLSHLIRSTYREIQENITDTHPRIYRQVKAGAEIAAIALPKELGLPESYEALRPIPVIRQVLIYPPLIFNPPMNKRTGAFTRVDSNPLDNATLEKSNWLCYPARVGPLLILIYFPMQFFELGFSMCNLFELADDKVLQQPVDAVFLYGLPDPALKGFGTFPTVFYEDHANDLLVGAIPGRSEFGYFGYVKKMALTLHNIKMMKMGRMPFHGALVNITIHGHGSHTVLIMGDTGAGKSETIEALRTSCADEIEDLVTIADDMGSLAIGENGEVLGYGTEVGAFVRLDDLQTGYAFGQIDRTIIMSPDETNARVVLPVTTYHNIVCGFPIDIVLYANNYEPVDEQHPTLQSFSSPEEALGVFRAGKVMSKGTTTTTGMVQTFFANVFGPQQYPEMYNELADRFFAQYFKNGAYVGQMRTQLGIPGREHTGPEESAHGLLDVLRSRGKTSSRSAHHMA